MNKNFVNKTSYYFQMKNKKVSRKFKLNQWKT